MTSVRTAVGLAMAAVIALGGAAWQWQANHAASFQEDRRGERVLDELLARANDVAAITVLQGNSSVRVARKTDGDGYELAGRGYPVKPGKFHSAVVSAASLEFHEAKTAREDRYALIEVDDPTQEGANGRLLRFEDAQGKVIAQIIIGKTARGRIGGALKDGQYVRLPNEDRSWLAAGVVDADVALQSWVDPDIVALKSDKVVMATFEHGDGEKLVIRRTGVKDSGIGEYTVDGLPGGKQQKDDNTVRYTAQDLANVRFVDVRKDDGATAVYKASILMADGMTVEYEVTADDWLRVKVTNIGSDKATAEDIGARTQGWQYKLEDYKLQQFKKRMADVVAE